MNKNDDKLYNAEQYTSETRYVFGSIIYEYDITQANINILHSYDLISDFEYQWLQLAPKQDRQYYIGKKAQMDIVYHRKQKSDINRCITEGVLKARRLLLDSNQVQDDQVLRAAKDSVYINRPLSLQYTSFDLNNNGKLITFTLRNIFDDYIRFSNELIVLISDNENNFNIDVKGIKDSNLHLHQPMIATISQLASLRSYNKEASLSEFDRIYQQYVSLQSPIDMYREFNSWSAFRYKNQSLLPEIPAPTYLPENFDRNLLDISYNLNVLRELYTYLYN